MSGGGVTYYLEQARQKSNARMIIIDPRYTDTGAGRDRSGSLFVREQMPHWLTVWRMSRSPKHGGSGIPR
ncbi:hypothetical protein DMI62_06645 [Escherichia coli]|nr:hypothetical protein [Escherichia coli]